MNGNVVTLIMPSTQYRLLLLRASKNPMKDTCILKVIKLICILKLTNINHGVDLK